MATAQDNHSRGARLRLGELLLKKKAVTREQIQEAQERQEQTGHYLGETLMELGYVSSDIVYRTVSEQLGIPFVDIADQEIDPAILQLVPEKFARRFGLLPLSLDSDIIEVAIADHLDIVALDTIARDTGYRIKPLLCGKQDIGEAIEHHYGSLVSMEESLKELLQAEEAEDESSLPSAQELEAEADDAPVVRFVNLLIHQAIEKRASDIHIEPQKHLVQVRVRIDGVLHKMTPPTKTMFPAVVSRVKILSGLDIAERRLPQDGRCKIEDKNIDIRVSTLPTVYGEKVVMRLLDKSRLVLDLAELGLEPAQQELFTSCLQRPQGIILVTGPTGSGKTTTLYSGLSIINNEHRNIITVEDPVEYEIQGINQVHVRPAIGLSFASGLRSILRQDPDVVMVGEIRDLETAGIAVRAALTGHLVLSTLHTNDAVATINRLRDMGVKAYLLGSCLTLLMAQRLVRKTCEHCREPYDPPDGTLERLDLPRDGKYYHGVGCRRCNDTGYLGRLAILEMVPVDKELGRIISHDAPEGELRQAVQTMGIDDLRASGVHKIRQGLTTPEEIIARTME